MNRNASITCAIAGAGDPVDNHPTILVTPAGTADSAIEAARAGAAIVHVHVRDPETGRGAHAPTLHREAIERIRASGTDEGRERLALRAAG